MVSTTDLILKTFLDKLKWIKLSINETEMKQRIEQSIRFYEGCLSGSTRPEIIISPSELSKLLSKKEDKPEK